LNIRINHGVIGGAEGIIIGKKKKKEKETLTRLVTSLVASLFYTFRYFCFGFLTK
jgi:hypothetical protein